MKKHKEMRTNKSMGLASTPGEWIIEIAEAYLDAYDAISFGTFVGHSITETELFQMAPQVCLKFRGIRQSRANVKKATEAMLSSYVATQDHDDHIFQNAHIAFSFAYLASHYGMGLLSEAQVAEIMDCIESHAIVLGKAIEKRKMAKQ
jgi:hypothetical protein